MRGKFLRILSVLASIVGSPRLVFGPPLDFNFDPASGLSGKIFTPNGDGANDAAIFRFTNPFDSAVTLEIFDMTGALTASLSSAPGQQKLVWDGTDGSGNKAAAGIYIYRLRSEERAFSGAVVVAR